MKTTIYKALFIDAFTRAGRASKFSHQALELIFEDIEQIEQDTGEETELDVIAICYAYAVSSASDLLGDHSIDFDGEGDETDAVREYLHNHTVVVGETPDGFVYVQF